MTRITGHNYLPALVKERETQRAKRKKAATMAQPIRIGNASTTETLDMAAHVEHQPVRPGADDHKKYKSRGYFC